jgi:hypothetical protein
LEAAGVAVQQAHLDLVLGGFGHGARWWWWWWTEP